jgi:gluconate kinase
MKYIDNTTQHVTVLHPKDYIDMMQSINPNFDNDYDRSGWLEYVLQASKHYDVIFDNGTVILSDKG